MSKTEIASCGIAIIVVQSYKVLSFGEDLGEVFTIFENAKILFYVFGFNSLFVRLQNIKNFFSECK